MLLFFLYSIAMLIGVIIGFIIGINTEIYDEGE